MNDQGQIAAKKRIGEITSNMLDGSMNYLEGALELLSLREEVGVYENDPDFVAFVAVSSEIDSLPIEGHPKHWSKDVVARHELEIQESITWAKEVSLENCKSLAKRYTV